MKPCLEELEAKRWFVDDRVRVDAPACNSAFSWYWLRVEPHLEHLGTHKLVWQLAQTVVC